MEHPAFKKYRSWSDILAMRVASVRNRGMEPTRIFNPEGKEFLVPKTFGSKVSLGNYIVVHPNAPEAPMTLMSSKAFGKIYIPCSEKPNDLNFGDVIAGLKNGNTYARRGWNGKGIFITLQVPDEHSKMTQPYIYIVTLDLMTDNPDAVRGRVPWLASQTDMLAEDWVRL